MKNAPILLEGFDHLQTTKSVTSSSLKSNLSYLSVSFSVQPCHLSAKKVLDPSLPLLFRILKHNTTRPDSWLVSAIQPERNVTTVP